jgi:predicted dehydrogenase
MLRIGFIGAGGIANAHANALSLVDQVRVTAVLDVDLERAQQFGDKHKAKVCASMRQLLRNSDAVYICTPPFARLKETLSCARAGKHIFAEKPICLTMSEARKIAKGVDKARIHCMVGYVLHYWPNFKAVHDVAASGELGDLQVCWCNRMGLGPRGGWIEDPKKSGGMTVEFNSHDIDWLLWVGGPAREVYGKTLTIPGDGIERNVWGIFTFAQGIGVLGSSWAAPVGWSAFGVIGSRGMVFCGQDGKVRKRPAVGEEVEVPLDPIPDAMVEEDRLFVESVLADKQPPIPLAAGVAALQASLAIQKSSASGKPVRLSPRA